MIVLFNNPHPIPPPSTIPLVYDTSASGVTTAKISPSARISNFCDFSIYKINSQGHNVLLKYKGKGVVAPRLGNAISRVGLISALQGKQFAKNRIDFASNVVSTSISLEITGSAATAN